MKKQIFQQMKYTLRPRCSLRPPSNALGCPVALRLLKIEIFFILQLIDYKKIIWVTITNDQCEYDLIDQ